MKIAPTNNVYVTAIKLEATTDDFSDAIIDAMMIALRERHNVVLLWEGTEYKIGYSDMVAQVIQMLHEKGR